MKPLIIHIAIYLAFYIFGAYATTDILRLLKGTTVPVNASDCYCPVCRKKIALYDQLPVISYFINHGSCRNCKSPIPSTDLFLEVFLFLLMSAISSIFQFSWLSFALCILIYEGTKAVFLFHFGKRETAFSKNLLLSFGNNLLLFSFLAFLFALEHLF